MKSCEQPVAVRVAEQVAQLKVWAPPGIICSSTNRNAVVWNCSTWK